MQDDPVIYEEILRARADHVPVALALVTESRGSAPQKPGAKMLVWPDGRIIGTIGGGAVEAEVIRLARQCLEQGGGPRTVSFDLTEEHGFLCGGRMIVYIESLRPQPHLVILGAGHVGKALAAMAGFCGFKTTVVDDRFEYANSGNIPHADAFVVEDFSRAIQGLAINSETFMLIATRGHEHDFTCLQEALRTPAPYIGVVGSKRKRAGFFKALLDQGFKEEDLNRIRLPVGLAIGSVAPEEIAVSIMAQIIEQRRNYEASSDRRAASGCGEVPADGLTKAAFSVAG